MPPLKQTAFVTGSTGLLGNNLVRELLTAGFAVRALARSKQKAERQLGGLNVEVIEGDILDVKRFTGALTGVDVIFHTAAYFRDSFKGGSHWKELQAANVAGTKALLEQSYSAGVRRFVHASSIAVLDGERGQTIDETMQRRDDTPDDYYRSKILSDREVFAFLERHRDMWAALVLPGWMFGPGDIGPTSSGQTVLDFVNRKIPGIPPGTFPLVDARDVAQAMIFANDRGRSGERYLAAGRHMTGAELFALLAEVSGVPTPTRRLPLSLLFVVGALSEVKARLTKRPVTLSWATVRAVSREMEKSRFSGTKSERELGLKFRPVRDTLNDEIHWYRNHGFLSHA